MTSDWPRYLLFADATDSDSDCPGWRFVLSAIDSAHTISAEDTEDDPLAGGRVERQALMAALRGLEALDQPSLVTLVCPSRYVLRGFERGLKQWREEGWKWECFGRRAPIRDADLWRRVDQTLKFHRVDCRSWRFGSNESAPLNQEPLPEPAPPTDTPAKPRRRFDLANSRIGNDPALLVVTSQRTRRGVIRFDDAHHPPAPAGRRTARRRAATVAS